MRKLLWVVLVLSVLWAGYWVIGWYALSKGMVALIDGLRVQEVTATYADLSVAGFPNRFDVTLSDPAYDDPVAGIGWRGSFLQLITLSYQPQHYIAVLPPAQVLTIDRRPMEVTSTDMRASLIFVPGPSFVLNRIALVAQGLDVAGWHADEARLGTRRADGTDLAHDVGGEALRLSVPDAPALVERLYLDATVGFHQRLDRHALANLQPPARIELRELSVAMGAARLHLSGTLVGDDRGFASGDIVVVAQDWPSVLSLLVASGLIDRRDEVMTQTALRMLSGGQDRLETVLSYKDGLVSLGPIPLGGAPSMAAP